MKIFPQAHPSGPALVGFLALFAVMNAMVPPRGDAATFGDDVAFLQKYTDLVVLRDQAGAARVAVAPAWQGRVMTSTAGGEGGASFGWINRELIAASKLQPHINVFGGEDRFWLGPEGGQFSIFFAPGAKFELVQFTKPAGVTDYVNSLWKLQDKPYGGDAANSYNDGPPAPGAKPLGPFYELESSSPAAALAPGQSLTHVHRTLHLSGAEKDLDVVARAALGVSLDEMMTALKR